MNPARKPMNTLDCWKPRKLEEHGNRQETEARNLFETYGADLDPSDFVIVENLLAWWVESVDRFPLELHLIRYPYSAEDLGRLLREKRNPLARFRVARRYNRRASEVLRTIEVSYMMA